MLPMESQATQKITKNAARSQVKQVFSSLTDLESTLGKKKFRRRMRKVEKILLNGLPKTKKGKAKKQLTEQEP